MFFGIVPSAGVVGVLAGGVAKSKVDADGFAEAFGGDNLCRYLIARGVAYRLYRDRFPIQPETAIDITLPKVEPLRYAIYLRRLRFLAVTKGQFEPHYAQMEPVGIDAVPLNGLLLPLRRCSRLDSVEFGLSPEVVGLQRFGVLVSVGIGKAVPSPRGLGSRIDARRVVFGEGLQPCGIDGEGEAAISNRQGGKFIDALYYRAVAGYQCLSVNGGSIFAPARGEEKNEQRYGGERFHRSRGFTQVCLPLGSALKVQTFFLCMHSMQVDSFSGEKRPEPTRLGYLQRSSGS